MLNCEKKKQKLIKIKFTLRKAEHENRNDNHETEKVGFNASVNDVNERGYRLKTSLKHEYIIMILVKVFLVSE